MRYCRYRNQIPSAGNPEVAKVFPSGWSGRDCSFLCFVHCHDFCLSDFRFPVLLKSSLSQSSSKKVIRVVNNHKHYHNFTWLHILLSFAMFPVFELTYQAVKCIFLVFALFYLCVHQTVKQHLKRTVSFSITTSRACSLGICKVPLWSPQSCERSVSVPQLPALPAPTTPLTDTETPTWLGALPAASVPPTSMPTQQQPRCARSALGTRRLWAKGPPPWPSA